MTMQKRIDALNDEYTKALEFGVADLNQAVKSGNVSEYFHAIERHEKLSKAVEQGLNCIYTLKEYEKQKV